MMKVMDIPLIEKRQLQSNHPPPIILPDELITEILSLLDVQTILRLKSVNKSWNSLISHPTFVQMHLNKSSQNPNLTVIWKTWPKRSAAELTVLPFPFRRLIESPFINAPTHSFNHLNNHDHIFGSCNGLIAVVSKILRGSKTHASQSYSIYFLNPATRKKSKNLGFFCYTSPKNKFFSNLQDFKFAFGYDDSTKTYKVVAFCVNKADDEFPMKLKSVVKVFSLDGDNCWRNIQSFPVIPLSWGDTINFCSNNGVHISGPINWLANPTCLHPLYEYTSIHGNEFVIVSLDLSTETYKQLLLPQGFDEVPYFEPVLKVLMESLCFGHDFKKTDFVLWQMKVYGVQASWTRLLKISYMDLKIHYFHYRFQLLCLYKNGDMVIFETKFCSKVFVYNLRNKKVEKIKSRKRIKWYSHSDDYIESLVSVC